MTDDAPPPTVAELAEYCRLQAGLLSGRAETLGSEARDLLDDLDAEVRALRADLADGRASADDVAALESDLAERQALVEAKQARVAAFQDLAAAYLEVAGDVEDCDDWRSALERVVEFERDRDAPAYFPDRQTVLEAAAASGGPGDASEDSGDAADDSGDADEDS